MVSPTFNSLSLCQGEQLPEASQTAMTLWKKGLAGLAIAVVVIVAIGGIVWNYVELDPYVSLYNENCGGCHGDHLEGTSAGIALVGQGLPSGDSVGQIIESIRNRHPQLGQPAFLTELSEVEAKGLAIFVGERRLGQRFTDFKFDHAIHIPEGVQVSETHAFRMETLINGLSPLVFSLEPLPDGSWLVTEKERGLSVVSAEGVQGELIRGTPRLGSSLDLMGVQYGTGWLLDVAIHPDYETNGWVYLHYTDLCSARCEDTSNERSMNRLDRGRIRQGEWVDVETIWQAPLRFYETTPDTGAGGRIAFDQDGHVFISVGIKSPDGMSDVTAQNLDIPYGKIHRINDDGSIPVDNPFVSGPALSSWETAGYTRQSVWTYGHRSPQGLEWHRQRGRVWNAEMGPRGGDEINELIPGRNYGWPFYSLGLEYLGAEVERHKSQGIEFDVSDMEATLVDITPSPGTSSFAFYEGDQFPDWHQNVLLGSLKGSALFRLVFDGNTFLHRETLINDLARIRDVEIGYDGLVYLLLENKAGSAIVRLVPVDGQTNH